MSLFNFGLKLFDDFGSSVMNFLCMSVGIHILLTFSVLSGCKKKKEAGSATPVRNKSAKASNAKSIQVNKASRNVDPKMPSMQTSKTNKMSGDKNSDAPTTPEKESGGGCIKDAGSTFCVGAPKKFSIQKYPSVKLPTASARRKKEDEMEKDKQAKIASGFYQEKSDEDDTLEKIKSLQKEKSESVRKGGKSKRK